MVKKITGNDMSAVLSSPAALVDFSAQWCGPCQILSPVLEELSCEFDGTVEFFQADVDENNQLAMEYGIQSIPAVYLFCNGEAAGQMIGFQPKESLRIWLEQQLS